MTDRGTVDLVVDPISGDREASERASGDGGAASREVDLDERPRYAFPYSRLAVRDRMIVE